MSRNFGRPNSTLLSGIAISAPGTGQYTPNRPLRPPNSVFSFGSCVRLPNVEAFACCKNPNPGERRLSVDSTNGPPPQWPHNFAAPNAVLLYPVAITRESFPCRASEPQPGKQHRPASARSIGFLTILTPVFTNKNLFQKKLARLPLLCDNIISFISPQTWLTR
jgi:hypothetical protein